MNTAIPSPSPAPSPPSHLVLTTPELLSLILRNLPPTLLLLPTSLVSKSFHSTIHTCPYLLHILGFTSLPLPSNSVPPLLSIHFTPFLSPPSAPNYHNPNTFNDLRYRRSTTLPTSIRDANFKRYNHPSASWRRMLITQPPLYKLRVTQRWRTQHGESVAEHEAERREGVRMGEIYDLCEDWQGEWGVWCGGRDGGEEVVEVVLRRVLVRGGPGEERQVGGGGRALHVGFRSKGRVMGVGDLVFGERRRCAREWDF